jgi:hypothetical protein
MERFDYMNYIKYEEFLYLTKHYAMKAYGGMDV